MTYVRLQIMSYASMLLYLSMVIFTVTHDEPRDPGEGLWVTVFLVYLAYVAVPCPMIINIFVGILLPVIQITLSQLNMQSVFHHDKEQEVSE